MSSSATVEVTGKFIKINVETEFEYKNIQIFLQQEQVYCRRLFLERNKNQMFVLRDLPENTNINIIKNYLYNPNFQILSIQQLFRGNTWNKILLSLLFIQLPRLAHPNELYEVIEIME